jgi:hypothetical protein
MALEFHQGDKALYRRYASKPWNDAGLLMLNTERDKYDKWLMDTYNTEDGIRTLFQGNGPKYCYPWGQEKSKLGDYVTSEESSIIIVKGLHQWKRKPVGFDYTLHLTFGLDGQLWHLDATYNAGKNEVRLGTKCTAGERMTDTTHDGFTVVKR